MTCSENSILNFIRALYPSPAYTVLGHVRNGTGFQKQVRTADAVIASTWPSRGLWLAGVEIKISTSDFKRELADPEKADGIKRYCKYWFVAAPVGVVDRTLLPETWGLIECDKKAKIVKAAPPFAHQPPDMAFLCSILRNITDTYVPKKEVTKLAMSEAEKLSEHRSRELAQLKENIAKFKEFSGLDLNDREHWCKERLGMAVKMVRDSRILESLERITKLRADSANIIACCDKLIDAIKNTE